MIDDAIVGRSIPTDLRGKIKSGKRDPQTKLPVKLDYFNVERFPELVEAYGEHPQGVIIFFPTNDPSTFLHDDFVKWGKKTGDRGTRVRVCDGKECRHLVSYELLGNHYEAGQRTACVCKKLDPKNPEQKKQMCKADVYLKAYIYHPKVEDVESPLCYTFETHSINSLRNIRSMIELVLKQFGYVYGVPFLLTVKMATKSDDVRSTYPLWNLTVIGTKTVINRAIDRAKQAGQMLIAKPTITDEGRLLEQGNIEIVNEEFVPDGEPESGEETIVGAEASVDQEPAPEPVEAVDPTSLKLILDEIAALPADKATVVAWRIKHVTRIMQFPTSQSSQIFSAINERLRAAHEAASAVKS